MGAPAPAAGGKPGDDEERGAVDDGDDDVEFAAAAAAEEEADSEPRGGGAHPPKLRTRVFLSQLLLRLPALAAAASRRHIDPAAETAAKNGTAATTSDWLVDRLAALVDVAFRMATGELEVSTCMVGDREWAG